MGKKRLTVLGSENEDELKAKHARQLEQKKLREGKEVAAPEPVVQKTVKKTVHLRSKSYSAAKSLIDPEKTYPLSDALVLLRKTSLTKFDPTVELHLSLKEKISPKQVDLPHSTGKVRRLAIADADTIAKIEKGVIDFDVLFASPTDMAKLVKYAKILGPKGLMPNPKTGTVVDNPTEAAKKLSSKNTLTLKVEKDAPLIHTIVGKLSLKDQALSDNITSILSALSGIKKAVLKSTMSPAIKLVI